MLRQRYFSLLVGAVGLSALGDWLALTPLALHLQEETGSGLVVAGLFLAIWSPVILLAGPAGALADRMDRTRLLLAVSLFQAAVSVVLGFVGGTPAILVLTALLGAGFAFAQPAEFALVPEVAGEDRLSQANGYVETSRSLGFVLGPVVGGLLSAAGGVRIALLVNAMTFLARRVAALALGALVCIVIQGLGLALPTLWLVFAFALAAYVVGGLAHGTKNVLVRTLIHERVPDRLRGRAFAAYNGLRNAAELVAILGGGILIVAIGARWTLFLAGAIPVVAGALALALTRRSLAIQRSAASWAS
jgi:MFS family permease